MAKNNPVSRFFDWLTGEDKRRSAREQEERQYANAWEMYERTRKDAIADRDYANEYNSPSSIMTRLRAAGLNPNLIYGSSIQASESIRGASAQGAPDAVNQYGEPRFGEMLNLAGAAVSGASAISAIKTAASVRSKNLADTNLASANTARALADAAKTNQEREQASQLFGTTLRNAQITGDKIARETAAIGENQELRRRELSQRDEQLLQNARKITQQDIKLSIDRERTNIQRARNAADIRKINEDILKSMVYRETNTDVRRLMQSQISSAESKAAIDAITAQYTSRILDAQLNKSSAEVTKLYSSMAADILGILFNLTK